MYHILKYVYFTGLVRLSISIFHLAPTNPDPPPLSTLTDDYITPKENSTFTKPQSVISNNMLDTDIMFGDLTGEMFRLEIPYT